MIITTAISGYFNPTNIEPYSEKVRKYSDYLKEPIINEALHSKNYKGLSMQRKFIIWLIRFRLFCVLDLLGKIRKKQKESR